ncbi:MAG: tetratricopeptide repeat protein [Phycisphaerales bacterium]|nr:tetratricopeptide repeat protein [Phycisphaerales bacterium]MCB9864268.1 tetratricopeptide repeat protein [Phycisphaerales bacterium]
MVFAIHIIHWKLTGKTLAPLELNEVMYTLELGIITAGFIFMCSLVLLAAIFGRFFCSWACHIMVLQDASAWILRKFGIERKPIRSRLLLLVPLFTAFYMFVWPQILRIWRERSFPEFHLRTDADGWASFATNNFWRNLPSAPIIILTFLVCGFAIVYLLGSRTFCTYVCPYGAIFGVADRIAPGRIRRVDECHQCGKCTAACTSGIRVHEEVKLHGMIVNPACLKDMDCVSACPNGSLQYGFGKPALLASIRSGGRFGKLRYDFSLAEDILQGVVFLIVLFAFRGLYSRIPFLLSLALGAIIGVSSVFVVRLITQSDVALASLRLKRNDRITRTGLCYSVVVACIAAFVIHSGFVRYHEFTGLSGAFALTGVQSPAERDRLAAAALPHLEAAEQWGLIRNERVERSMLDVLHQLKRFSDVEARARQLIDRNPYDLSARLVLGSSLAAHGQVRPAVDEFRTVISNARAGTDDPDLLASAHRALATVLVNNGKFAEGAAEFRELIRLDAGCATAHAGLGSALAELGNFEGAVSSLREAVRIDSNMGGAQYNLGTLLARLNRFDEAIPCYEHAIATMPDDADLLNNLGYALMRTGMLKESSQRLRQALALDPNHANAHFNLGNVLSATNQRSEAVEQYRKAAALDPVYSRLFSQ